MNTLRPFKYYIHTGQRRVDMQMHSRELPRATKINYAKAVFEGDSASV